MKAHNYILQITNFFVGLLEFTVSFAIPLFYQAKDILYQFLTKILQLTR